MNRRTTLITTATLVSLFLLNGCNSRKSEAAKFKSSYGVLYPAVKAGEGIAYLGNSLQTLGQPAEWTPKRPDKLAGVVSSEQDAYLKQISVRYDPSEHDFTPAYFSAGSYMFGAPIQDMLVRVENAAGMKFDWRFSPMLQDVAMAFPGGVIIVNPNVMGTLSPGGQFVYLFHEAGHHVLGHTSSLGFIPNMNQSWLSIIKEQAADGYAGQAMAQSGFSAQEIAYGAMDAFKTNPPQGTSTHPPRDVRIQTVLTAAGIH